MQRLFLLMVIVWGGYKVFDWRLYKLMLNQARLIQKTNSTILGNKQPLANSYVYQYSDENSEKIILYLENSDAYKGRDLLIIDKKNKRIGKPNSNIRDYSKWGNYIFQNNSGERFIPFKNDVKRIYFDPNLNVNNNELSFNLPKGEGYKFETISIKL